ncbi:type II toxin-antitoxin system RelE/ParE family toxin [uncultured Thiodictyon sp.]|uniref:type II toxin-antitoxin system RelE/ParE family toxin n=1 Tax=uncultured Thiodictyon sp. TaxID=1846217 RepID=UPI0025DF2512|nr:type II toxin-antitoxin system RelE/ParE family toxin [uncultured Thiodictyon sp.]
MRLRWTRRAASDLDGIETDIEVDDPQAAVRMVLRILDAAERLVDHPYLGRSGRVPGTRELVIAGSPYIVAYRIGSGSLEILRVLHAAMRWPDSL